MSSSIRIESSRANGVKSRGPVTPEGKARSSRNAVRHGMLAETVVLDAESAAGFSAHLARLHDELKPEPGIESTLVETMAVASWRQMRLWSMEKMQLDAETRNQQMFHADEDDSTCLGRAFRCLCDNSKALENINRYETRYDHQYHRALTRFVAWREGKRKKRDDAVFPNEPNLS